MFNLVLFGPPGSGKGTQSEMLVSKYRFTHLSTGDLLRSEISERTPLGLEAKKFMDRGELVPDEVVIGMIGSALDHNFTARGFLFDGFPRTLEQAECLDKLLQYKRTSIHVLISLNVSEDELVKRLLKRGESSGRPDDKDEQIIRTRILEYKAKTAVVANYYQKAGKAVNIAAEGSVDDIFNHLCKEIDDRFIKRNQA